MIAVETYPTLAEAARAMGQGAAFLGGGTVLMRDVNAGEAPARIVRTTDPALNEIRASGDTVRLGAGVTMADILESPDLAFLHPVARLVGGPQVRNMGTIGGNLFLTDVVALSLDIDDRDGSTAALLGCNTASKRRSTVRGSMTRSYCGGRYGPRSRSATDQMKLARCWKLTVMQLLNR